MRSLGLVVVGLFLSLQVNAAAPSGWYHSVTVQYVYAGQVGGRAAVRVNGTVNYGTCPGPEFTFDTASEYFPYMFALVTSAYLRNLPINIYTDGTCTAQGIRATDVSLGALAP